MVKTKDNMKLVPKLRFSGFKGNWERGVLSDNANVNPESKALPKEFIYIDLESVTKGELTEGQSINREEAPSRAQRVMGKCEILYQTVRPYQRNNLFFNKDGNYVASTGYAQIKAKGEPRFLYQLLHTTPFVNNAMRRSTGTSYPAINSSDLEKIPICSPTLPEQEKIASFLAAVDKKIEQLSRRKELLGQYKKGVMQKIFSQEIRFTDDNGKDYPDWEEKKLGDLLAKVIDNRGKTPPVTDSGIPLIEVNALENRLVDYSKVGKYVSEDTYDDWFRAHIEAGDVLFSTVGSTAICSLYDGAIKSCIAQNIVGLRYSSDSKSFLLYLLTEKRNNHKFKRIEMVAVQPSVKVSQMIHIKFDVPSLLEQIKIVSFLTNIDKKIEFIQNQLARTQTFKKGLLQQLFV